MNKYFILIIIVLAAVTRLIPHPPNFTPLIAMGLFGGAYIHSRSLAVLIPIGAMFLSDLILGLHGTVYWVYGSLLLVAMLGMILLNKVNMKYVLILFLIQPCKHFSLVNSILKMSVFFLIVFVLISDIF